MQCRNCSDGLGFSIDWGGIIGNTVKAYGAVQQARSALTVQRAQHAAALRAQELELQAMQRRQAQTIAPPVGVQPEVSTWRGVRGSPQGAAVPSWLIPAAFGVGVLFLMRK